MSGIEIVGLVGTCITLFEASIKAYNTIKDLKGVPDAFKEVSKRLPLVERTLSDAKAQLDKAEIDEALASKIKPILENCEKKAGELKNIFEKLAESKGGKILSTYRKLVGLTKEHRVEVLMQDILKDIQVLVGNQTLRLATKDQVELLQKAIQELSQVKPSIPDSKFASAAGGINNWDKGKQNIVFGDGDIIDNEGDVFKAQKQVFSKSSRSKKKKKKDDTESSDEDEDSD
jgi:hypothetical protein